MMKRGYHRLLIADGLREREKEEGVAKIPITINRFIVDSIPYSIGRMITWLSSLQFGGTALIVIVVYKVLSIVK